MRPVHFVLVLLNLLFTGFACSDVDIDTSIKQVREAFDTCLGEFYLGNINKEDFRRCLDETTFPFA